MDGSGEAMWALLGKIRNGEISIDEFVTKFGEIFKDGRLQTLKSVEKNSNNTIFHEALFIDEVSKAVLDHFESSEEDEIVEILKQKNKEGYTVFHLAVKQNQTSVVKLLFEWIDEDETKLELINQDLSEMEGNARTILHLAEQKECHDLIDWIVQSMPILRSIRRESRNALYEVLQASAENDNVKRFETLLNIIPRDCRLDFLQRQKENYGWSVVHIAFKKGNAEVLRAIKRSLDPESENHLVNLLSEENNNYCTPVQLAIRYKHFDLIPLLKELLKSPKDICKVLRAGTTPALYFSAISGHDRFEKVFALIPEGEHKNMLLHPSKSSWNVVHLIFFCGMIEALKVIENTVGCDSDSLDEILMSTDANGYTPLHFAAEQKQYKIIQHVIKHPKRSNKKLLEILVKVNVRKQSVVSIASNKFFEKQELEEILKPLASYMKEVKIGYEGCKETCKTAKENYTKAEEKHSKAKIKVQKSKLAKEKSDKKYYQKKNECYEADCQALQKCQETLDERYKKLSKAEKELHRSESTRKAIAKDLQLVDLVIHEGGPELDEIVTGLLELMDSPIESLGLLILHAESGNADFINKNQKIVCQTLKKSFEDQKSVNQALEYLKKRAKQDISDEEIKESRQNLLGLATSNMADQKADQYVLRWTDSSGNTLAHIAALAEDIESIERLVEWQITSHPNNKDSVLHSVNDDGQTPGTVSGNTQKPTSWESELSENLDKYLAPIETGLEFLIFYQSENRKDAEEEAYTLKKFGRAFGVEPTVHADMTCDEIKKKIKTKEKKVEPASCLIVAILAHGTSGQVAMSDRRMEIKDIVEQMKIRQGNRPMVLLLQACQSEPTELPYPERQLSDVLQEDMPEGETVTDYLKGTRRHPESTLREMLSRHKVPCNIKLQSVPPLEMVRSDNLVLRSTFVVGKMVNDLNNTSRNEQEMRNLGTDAISMLSQAYCFLKRRPVRTRTTADGFPEEHDLSITSGYAFDHVPPHFLCLSATVNAGTATRGLMTRLLCQKLNEMICHQRNLAGTVEIDIQRLFEHVVAAVHVESLNGQVSIIAQTLLKRLCLRVERPVQQANDSDDDDEDKKGDEVSNKGDNSQQPVN